MLVTKINITSS